MTKPKDPNEIRIQAKPSSWLIVNRCILGFEEKLFIRRWCFSNTAKKDFAIESFTIDQDEALAVAAAIYKLFKKEDN